MENEILQKVVNQKVDGIPFEEFMAQTIVQLEEQAIGIEWADIKIKAYKQLNVRHKNIIDAQRVQLKEYELILKKPVE